jgi:Uma2 family endonuclease
MEIHTLTLSTEPTARTADRPSHLFWPTQGQWRYEQLRQLSDNGHRYEIINGTLYGVSAPTYDHQLTAGELFYHLQRFVGANRLGAVDCAPCSVYLAEDAQLVQPDIVFWRGAAPAFDGYAYHGTPALISEVVAPQSKQHDRTVKFDLYEAAGVEEYWMADPATRTVEVYTLSSGEYALVARFGGDIQIHSTVLPGLTIRTNLLFSL